MRRSEILNEARSKKRSCAYTRKAATAVRAHIDVLPGRWDDGDITAGHSFSHVVVSLPDEPHIHAGHLIIDDTDWHVRHVLDEVYAIHADTLLLCP